MTFIYLDTEHAAATYYPTPAAADKHLTTDDPHTTPVLVLDNRHDRAGLALTGTPAQIRAFVRQITQVLDDYTPTDDVETTTDTGWIHTKTGETCADPFMCHHGHTSAR